VCHHAPGEENGGWIAYLLDMPRAIEAPDGKWAPGSETLGLSSGGQCSPLSGPHTLDLGEVRKHE
jgi:hypothetical protein